MTQSNGNKSKNKQMGPKEKLLHKEGNYKQGEKIALRMGENNSK